MPNLCKIELMGHLGRDAELKYTPQGKAVCEFSLAVNDRRDKNLTMWFRCALWGKPGESLKQYLAKGKPVFVRGDLRAREYESNGEKRTSLDVNVDDIVLLGGKEQDSAPARDRLDDMDTPF